MVMMGMTEKRFIIAICGDGKLGIRDLTTLNEYTSERQVADYMNWITDENEQLKEDNLRITKVLEDGGVILTKNQLKSLIEMKNDDSVEVRHLKSANAKLKDENQSLKNHIQMLQKHIKRLENDNIKTYTLIKEAYKTERTALGKSVLKQLLEEIQWPTQS